METEMDENTELDPRIQVSPILISLTICLQRNSRAQIITIHWQVWAKTGSSLGDKRDTYGQHSFVIDSLLAVFFLNWLKKIDVIVGFRCIVHE